MPLGEKLIAAAISAQQQATLVAPFIKVNALETILENLSPSVAVKVIARWIPMEIAAGVCDLEIFDLLSSRPNSTLFIHPFLHAKFYRFDNAILFGSANLTGKALGWRAPANIELLHTSVEAREELLKFEYNLLKSSVQVDAQYRDNVRIQVEKLLATSVPIKQVFEAETHEVALSWLPTCMNPERLYGVYSDPASARRRMVESAFQAAEADLAALGITPGLSELQFNQQIIASLGQMPLVQQIDAAASVGVTTHAAMALIEEKTAGLSLPYSPSEMWEILQAWLLHFFPQQYRREAITEVFRRGRVIE